MRLRSPSGKVITNKFIRSKLQKKQEKFSYSSNFTSPLLVGDVVWMNSHLINANVFNRFVTRYKSQVEHVLWQLVLSLKKIQHIEFFIENAKSKVFRLTGIRLRDEDLTGAWYRSVDFDTLYIKLLSTTQLAVSIRNSKGPDSKNYEFKSCDFKSIASQFEESSGSVINQVMAWHRLSGDQAIWSHQRLAWYDVLFLLVNQANKPNNQLSAYPLVYTNGELAFSFMFNENDVSAPAESVIADLTVSLEFKMLEFKMLESENILALTKGKQTITINLGLLASLYDLFPANNQLEVCQGFLQSLMLDTTMGLSYEQRRLIFLLVHVLSLNVLVKRKR